MNVNSIKFSSTREELVYVFDPNNPQKYRKQTHCSNNKLNNKKEIQIATECVNNIKKLNEEEEIYESISHCVHHLSGIFFQKFKSKTGNKLIEKIYEIFTKVKNIDPIMIIVPELYFGATKTIFIGKMAILSLIFAKYGKYGEAIRLICKIIENSNYNKETLKYLLWIYSWLVSNDRDEVIDSMLKEEEKTNFLSIFISKVAYIEKIIESHNEYLKNQNLSKKNIDDLSPINISCKEWKYMFSLFEILWSDRLIDSYSEKTWDTLSHVFPKCYRSPLYNNAERSREIAMRFCRLRNNFYNVLQYAIASREFGNLQESIELFTEASLLGHENSKDCFLDIADIYLQQKKYEDALIWYSKYPQNEKKYKWAFIHILHVKTILIAGMKNSFEQYLEMLKLFKQNLSASIDIIPQKRILQLIGEHVRLLQDSIDYLSKNNMVPLEFLYCNEIIFILMDYYPLGVTESLYKALQISQKNELISSQLKPVDRYNSRQLIALIYQRMKNYQLSLQSHNQSLEMASKIEDTHTRICAILQAMFNISTLHNITHHYPLALKNCNQALSLINMYIKKNHSTNKDEPNYFNQLINQGTYYNENRNNENNENNNHTTNNHIHTNNNNNNNENVHNENKILELQTLLKVYFQFLHLASEIHFKHKQWEDVNKLTEEAIYGIPFTNEKNLKEFCSLSDFHLIFLMYGKSNFHLHQKESEERNMDMTDESVFEHSESVEPLHHPTTTNTSTTFSNNPNVINHLKFRTLSDSQLSTKSSCETSQSSVEISNNVKSQASSDDHNGFSSRGGNGNFGYGNGKFSGGYLFGRNHLVRAKSVLEFSVSEKFESIFKGIESINNDEKPPNLFGLNSLQSNYLDYQLPQQSENNVLTVCVNSISETKADICSVLVDCYKVDNQLPKMIYYQQICNFIDYKLGKFKELLEGLYNISIMYMESNELVRAQRSFRAAITLAQNVSIEHTANILQRSLEHLGVIEKNLQNNSFNNNNQKK